ncbi:MAG: iron export ABC transporter permease subunit FetB [Phycisphaerae bacterium]|nr:iron export ABC transporter permease subunit FetB [Phycisphaerae bacterium]
MNDPSSVELIQLDTARLALAAGMVTVAGAVSMALRLKLERQLAIGAVRTVVQLLLLGLVLRHVFELQSVYAIAAVIAIMIAAATRAAVTRPKRTFRGAAWRAGATLVLSGILTTVFVTTVVVGVRPWYQPQYLIPLLGMVLGNALTATALCLDALLESLSENRAEIEMELAHGATRWEAARASLAAAVHRGMIPIINAMMVVGIVSLPGMMTGQILAGADPFEAVKYQIVVMFMLAAGVSAACIMMVWLVYRHMFTDNHQLRCDAIAKRTT